MATKRIIIQRTPLQVTAQMSLNLAPRQVYEAETGDYNPDFTLSASNLIITPSVSILDRDGTGRTASMSDMSWSVIENSVETAIASNSTYVVDNSTGALTIKRNFTPGIKATFRFTFKIADTATGQVQQHYKDVRVECVNGSDEQRLDLDCKNTVYNPLSDADTEVITARLYVGGAVADPANVLYVWEVWRGSAYEEIGTDILDYWATVNASTNQLTIDKYKMGYGQKIRCRAKYSEGGTPSAVTLNAASPTAYCTLDRKLPDLTVDFAVPTQLPGGYVQFQPRALVSSKRIGEIDLYYDASNDTAQKQRWRAMLTPIWRTVKNTQAGTGLTYVQVAEGGRPVISTDKISDSYGMILDMEVVDNGPLLAWADENGDVLVDEAGNIILI